MTDDSFWRQAVDAASRRYPGADRHARRFARAKLSHDRVFRHIFQQGLVPAGARARGCSTSAAGKASSPACCMRSRERADPG